MADIQTKVVLEVDNSKLNSGISQGINKATQQNQGNLQKQGTQMGSVLGRALGAAFSAISTKAIFDFANNAVQSYKQVRIAQASLSGSVQAYANRQQNAKMVIADTTKSYEEKALAIGYNIDNIYKETKATEGASNASKNLSRELDLQERAFNDSVQAVEQSIAVKNREYNLINRQINLLKKETDERVKLRREQLGGGVLDSELRQLKVQKDQLDVQKAQAEVANDPFATLVISNQINQLQKEINLREEKLDVIDNETQVIKDQAKVQEDILKNQVDTLKLQVDDLRFQLSSAQNKFDIDIEPARRKLQDLQASVSGGGGGTIQSVSDEFQKALDEAASEENVDVGKLSAETNKAIDNVFNNLGKKVGVTRSTLLKGAADLQLAGLTNPEEVEKTLAGFVKIASTGTIGMEEGIAQLTQQFRTENAALGERAGLQDEYISQIGPRGLAILQAEGKLRDKNYDSLTQEEKALAKSAGLRQNVDAAEAAFQARLEQGGFAADINRAKLEELDILIGEDLDPTWNKLNEELGKYLDLALKIVDANPGLATGITGVALAVGLLGGAFFLLGGPATLIIGGLIIGVGLLAKAWNDDVGGIRTQTQELGEEFKEVFGGIGVDFETVKKIGQIFLGFFVNMAAMIGSQLINVGRFFLNFATGFKDIFSGIKKFFEGDFKGGLTDVFKGLARIILNPFEFVSNAIIDIVNNVLRNYNNLNDVLNLPDVPEFQKVSISKTFDNIPGFASGGFPQGQNAIVQTNEAGQEYVANARATNALATFFDEIGKDFGGNSSSIADSYNQSFEQNNFGGQSNMGFPVPYGIT